MVEAVAVDHVGARVLDELLAQGQRRRGTDDVHVVEHRRRDVDVVDAPRLHAGRGAVESGSSIAIT